MSSIEALREEARSLAALAPDDLLAERVRRRAQAALSVERRLADRPWLGAAQRAWSGAIMPAAVTATVGVYLLWAIEFAGALYR